MKNIAISRFCRIGRAVLKVITDADGLEVMAINVLINIDNSAYLLKYGSVYDKYKNKVKYSQ